MARQTIRVDGQRFEGVRDDELPAFSLGIFEHIGRLAGDFHRISTASIEAGGPGLDLDNSSPENLTDLRIQAETILELAGLVTELVRAEQSKRSAVELPLDGQGRLPLDG